MPIHKQRYWKLIIIGLCFSLLIISACSNDTNNSNTLPENIQNNEINEDDPSENTMNDLENHENETSPDLVQDITLPPDEVEEEPEVEIESEPKPDQQANDQPDNLNEGPEPAEPPAENSDINENNSDSNVPDADETTNPAPTLPDDSYAENEERTLRIGLPHYNYYSDNFVAMRESYTKWFEWEHPSVEVEFVTATDVDQFTATTTETVEEMKQLMDSDTPPDVVFVSYQDYTELMADGYVVPLDSFMKNSELEKDDYVTLLIEALVNPADDLVYGLAPSFQSSALVYNKDLFDELGIGYPQDHMTWDEVFTLAKQVASTKEGIYGLMFNPYDLRPPIAQQILEWYVPGLSLSVLDESKNEVTIDNESWRNVMRTFKELYDAGVFSDESNEQAPPLQRNKFLFGNIGMVTMDYTNLLQFMGEIEGNDEPFAWDIVTIPVHPGARNVGANIWIHPILAINANGRNQQDAWALIESIHSEEWANHNADRAGGHLSSLRNHTFIYESELNYNKEALYQLRPSHNDLYYSHHSRFYETKTWDHEIAHSMMQWMDRLYSGQMTIEEAIDSWVSSAYSRIAQRDEEQGQ